MSPPVFLDVDLLVSLGGARTPGEKIRAALATCRKFRLKVIGGEDHGVALGQRSVWEACPRDRKAISIWGAAVLALRPDGVTELLQAVKVALGEPESFSFGLLDGWSSTPRDNYLHAQPMKRGYTAGLALGYELRLGPEGPDDADT